MRAVAYVRVSLEIQAAEGVSLDAQRTRIAVWCAAQGATLDPADVFVDAGISGKRADNRPALQAALDAVCRGGGVLVVYSLSRLARSTKDTIAIAERLTAAGADLVSLTEQINTTTAAGKMVFRLLAVLAEFERDLVSERTRLASAHKRSRGERWGQIPLGQALGPDGRSLVPDPAGVEALALIRRLRSEGRSLRAIAAELTARSIPTQNGSRRWTHSTVTDILKRDAPCPRPPASGPGTA